MESVNQLKDKVEDLKWFKVNFSRIQENYGGCYVAIEGMNIIGNDKSYSDLLDKLTKAGYDTSQVLIKKVPNKKEFLVYYG